MDRDKLRTLVEGIPKGRWMSYADLCVAAGGFADEARSVNQRLIQLEPNGAHVSCVPTAGSGRPRSAIPSGSASC